MWSSLSPESAGLPVLAAPPTASHTAAAALSLRAFSAATLQRSLAAHARSIDAAAQPLDRRRERGAVLTALAVATIQAFDYSVSSWRAAALPGHRPAALTCSPCCAVLPAPGLG